MSDEEFSTIDKEIKSKLFFNKYHCIQKLGSGSFGKIYKAEYNNNYFALKFEERDNNHNVLQNEAEVLNYLKIPQTPFIISYGYSGKYNILVMELLDKSLERLLFELKKFSIKTICMLAIQILTILENMHSKHIIHRDIKPDNFVMGKDDNSKYVYLLDFGLAKKFRSSKTLIQLKKINKKRLTGTVRYASINASIGYEQSRRDDLEGASYVLMYLARGNLPWQGMPGKDKDERQRKILEKKKNTTPSELCEGFPKEFELFCNYCRNLEYEEEPDYNLMRKWFYDVLNKNNFEMDFIYDWTGMHFDNNNDKGNEGIEDNQNLKKNEEEKENVGCGCYIF